MLCALCPCSRDQRLQQCTDPPPSPPSQGQTTLTSYSGPHCSEPWQALTPGEGGRERLRLSQHLAPCFTPPHHSRHTPQAGHTCGKDPRIHPRA